MLGKLGSEPLSTKACKSLIGSSMMDMWESMWLGDVVQHNTLKKEINIINALCEFSSSLYLGKNLYSQNNFLCLRF